MELNYSQGGSQALTKLVVRRRSWTPAEERCLIEAFKDIISLGWKAENGFKNGFLMQLESKMRQSIPGTDIRGDPHINSKYGTWKRQFKDVWETLKLSGFNWCSGTKTVRAEIHVWDEYIKAHPGMKWMREKPVPHYEVWVEMFGNDTAGGAGSNDNEHRRRRANQRSPPINVEEDGENSPLNDESPSAEPPVESGTEAHRTSTPPPVETKKRKRVDGIEELGDVIAKAWGKATESMEKIASRLGYEMDEADNRKVLWKIISELPIVIDAYQQVQATLAIGNHQKTLDMFHGMPDEQRCAVVRLALEGMLI